MSVSKFLPSLAIALSLGCALPAGATSISVSNGAFVDTGSFNSGSLPSNWTASGAFAGVVSGSVYNLYAAPAGDSTPYAYVGPGSSLSASYSSAPIGSLSLYWGSIDSYNGISFTATDGTVTTYYGNQIPGVSADTDSAAYVTFTDTGAAWNTVSFFSNGFSFEFDDVTTTPALMATPEPAMAALLGSGLLFLFFLVRNRRLA